MKTRTKKIILFTLAAYSLLLTGAFFNENFNLGNLIILTLSSICGIFLIYDIKDIDKTKPIYDRIKLFLCYKTHLASIIVLIFLMFFSLNFLSKISYMALAISGVLGVIYSITIKVFKLKEILVVKNLIIGVAWGILVLAGAGNINNPIVVYITVLAIIQVFIGSTIRDLKDKDYDKANNVNTLAVVFGVENSILILHLINLMSFILLYFFPNKSYAILLSVIFIWRFINLLYLRKNVGSKLWSQTINLLTCSVFFIMAFIEYLWN